MKALDSTFIIDALMGEKEARKLLEKNEDEYCTTQMNMYEVIRGLFLQKHNMAAYEELMDFFDHLAVLPLTEKGIVRSAEIFATLIKKGLRVEDGDCLTAGITLSHGVTTLITRNVRHFERVPQLKVVTY